MSRVDVTVRSNGRFENFLSVELPLELARQPEGDSTLLEVKDFGTTRRINIAPVHDLSVSRSAIRVESSGTSYRICNDSNRTSIYVNSEPLAAGESRALEEVSRLDFTEEISVTLTPQSEELNVAQSLRTLEESDPTINSMTMASIGVLAKSKSFDAPPGELAVNLVRQALVVVQKAAGSDEYFAEAVRASANMVQLDRVVIMTRKGENGWQVRARYELDSDSIEIYDTQTEQTDLPRGSKLICTHVLETKKTVIYDPQVAERTQGSSIAGLDRAVAAPMLDSHGNVTGILYGDRRYGSLHSDHPIGPLEATLLDVMAGAVASGLARQREESLRSALTQFFSPAVTERLERNENLLAGRDANVTVLFCDIRGFSSIAEKVPPAQTIEWINDVLTELSQCVIDTDGVLVDYVGDELLAMWGAPADQPDHATRACRAAMAMLDKIGPLRRRWQDIATDRFGFGIGINSGVARVGNTGSKVKFKYGPLGSTVNVASRVQGITKKFGVSAIVTASTRKQVHESEFEFRRLADVQLFGIKEVITVHELNAGDNADWPSICQQYEQALNYYHENDLTEAARELAMLVHAYPNDSPSVQLLGRVVTALTKHYSEIDPVIQFDTK